MKTQRIKRPVTPVEKYRHVKDKPWYFKNAYKHMIYKITDDGN